MKFSRHVNFAILRKCCILTHFNFAFLSKAHLEILEEATVRMEASTKNVEAIERFKQRVEQHYKESVNGQSEDCMYKRNVTCSGDGKQGKQ